MTSSRFSSRAVAACASVGLLALTACGSSSSEAAGSDSNEIASLQTESDTSDVATDVSDESASLSADEAALEFSQCLRDQGLDVADIGVDADGNIDLRSAFDAVGPGDADFQEAMGECGDILADVGFGGGARGGGFDDTAVQDAFLEFSDCIREQGFEDVPDLSFQAPGGGRPGGAAGPGAETGDGATATADGSVPARGEGQRTGGFGDRNTIFAEGLGLDPEDPAVIAALDECSPIIDGALGGAGGPGAPAESEG